ncbi:MAG: tetraacyldisaccharide 4'-kinase [Hyphomicrobiales bacterium]|nr:tetraacyldisaccharide 4'-kinase [Hyphomicrobiales bacterium]
MRAPAFWWKTPPGLTARLLQPLAALYSAVTLRRMCRPGVRVGCPVICVGNFTSGGAGKTPTALLLASLLAARGERPVFLSRGYGGSVRLATRVDLSWHSAAEVGDEPLLLARAAPTIVSRDRVAGAAKALEAGASVIIMDDGLQNPDIEKTLTLAVIDGQSGFGNGLAHPAGPLRADAALQASRVDAVILIGSDEAGRRAAALTGLPVIGAELMPAPAAAARLAGRRVFAMAGIGLPDKFRATLRACGAELVGEHVVADHAPYSAKDLAQVSAAATGLDALVATTAKDQVRIGARLPQSLRERLVVVDVTLEPVDGLDRLIRLLDRCLSASSTG